MRCPVSVKQTLKEVVGTRAGCCYATRGRARWLGAARRRFGGRGGDVVAEGPGSGAAAPRGCLRSAALAHDGPRAKGRRPRRSYHAAMQDLHVETHSGEPQRTQVFFSSLRLCDSVLLEVVELCDVQSEGVEERGNEDNEEAKNGVLRSVSKTRSRDRQLCCSSWLCTRCRLAARTHDDIVSFRVSLVGVGERGG